ncbi:hypothetical protein M404DRAFT_154698, partial [Pisolithus tinctorius Marx 270]
RLGDIFCIGQSSLAGIASGTDIGVIRAMYLEREYAFSYMRMWLTTYFKRSLCNFQLGSGDFCSYFTRIVLDFVSPDHVPHDLLYILCVLLG